MKLAVSNIAWSPRDTAEAYRLLRLHGVTGLEIAPGLFLPGAPHPTKARDDEIAAAKREAADHGLGLVSMQSLLFGVEGAALFGTQDERRRLEDAIGRAIALAARLGVPNLVFGSPGNRIVPAGMGAAAALEIWLPAFRRMAAAAEAAGVVLALEPNPERYGTNFMTSIAETAEVVRAVDRPGIRMTLDLGAAILTGEIGTLGRILDETAHSVSHVHLSAPDLAPLDTCPDAVRHLVGALADAGWDGWISIEMRGGGLVALPRAIGIASRALEAVR